MEEKEIKNRIKQYLDNQLSEAETESLLKWLEVEEINREFFARQKNDWVDQNSQKFDGPKIEEGKNRVKMKIENIKLEEQLGRERRINNILKYAASILLIVGLSASGYYFYSYKTFRKEVDRISLLAGNEIEVPYGSKSKIQLPDGSNVWINAGSKIKYDAGFGISSRKLYFEGEAYFDVTKNEKLPFIIETDLFNIKVHGTSFNVKSYLDDDIAETTLDRGSISISRNDKPDEIMNLQPKQKAIIQRKPVFVEMGVLSSDKKIPGSQEQIEDSPFNIEKNVDTRIVTAWKDNRLVFNQEPLGFLAKRLERQYNVNFYFSDEELKSFRYTAALKEMPIEQVLQAMSITTPILYKIEGENITLFKNKNFKLPTNSRETR